MPKRPIGILIAFAALAIGFVGLRLLMVVYTDLLWFAQLGFRETYLTMVASKTTALVIFGAFFAAFCGLNVWFARRYGQPTRAMALEVIVDGEPIDAPDRARYQKLAWIGLVGLLSLFLGTAGAPAWITALKYLNAASFGLSDPIFNREVGFYVFKLPLYVYIQGWLIAAIVATGLTVMASYHQDRAIRYDEGQWISIPEVRAHISVLAAILALLLAWGYGLKEYELLFSFRKDAFFGAGFTDLHAQIWAYRFMLLLLIGIAAMLVRNVTIREWRIPALGASAYVAGLVIVSWIAPIVYEQFIVKPNEFEREAPYIQHAIDYTRRAYDLDRIQEVPFPGESDLTARHIEANQATVQSIPLWDRRPLMDTYSQLQEIRSYYRFRSVDVDRYEIQGAYRQVMLAGREFARDPRLLQGDTWVNRHLVYTHGYGVVMSAANEIAAEGLPEFLIQDIPPTSPVGLAVDRPEIYYGENMRDYVFVGTNTQEFDYPKGDDNVYTTYAGKGGVSIGGFFRRLAFALRFADPFLFFSGAITEDSRVMFDRHIGQRLGEDTPRRFAKIAPFLNYDSDPYLALIDGRLMWIQDAYTATNMFPYAQPFGRPYVREMNYIRNAVKVVLDAYDGSVTYYAWDTTDPVLQSYMAIFPDLFKSADEIPDALRRHFRYPIDLFDIQASLYNTYHMTSPKVFYNREDVWEPPTEFYGTMDRPIRMSPYYVMVRLPDTGREEYILMLPASPAGKPNMIGWVFARCDAPHYGELQVYKLPKEKLIYGPMLIERRINQDTDVSREITLWDQRGSDVIRGNLLVIPIERSFIYVEPLYLRASQSGMPELKRVLVIHGEQLAMGTDLEDALQKVFAKAARARERDQQTEPYASREETPEGLKALARRAFDQFHAAQKYLKDGDFSAYGSAMETLRQTLAQMNEGTEPNGP